MQSLFKDELKGEDPIFSHNAAEYLDCFDFTAQLTRIEQLFYRDETDLKTGIQKVKLNIS